MNSELETKKYIIIRDFVPQQVLNLSETYYSMKFFTRQDFDKQVGTVTEIEPDIVQPYSVHDYGDLFTESLLSNFLPEMKKNTGIDDLAPTYSFVRLYEKGQWLKKHSDRPSCQYSITLPLVSTSSVPWSIYLDGTPVNLNLGDMLVYKGCEVKHWREPFNCNEKEYQIQAHLHYVDSSNHAYKPYVLDGRQSLGIK